MFHEVFVQSKLAEAGWLAGPSAHLFHIYFTFISYLFHISKTLIFLRILAISRLKSMFHEVFVQSRLAGWPSAHLFHIDFTFISYFKHVDFPEDLGNFPPKIYVS